jgi:alkylation response protein AidB-like acyl-CoA dehydrogenase
VDFAFNEEQDMLREQARSFLSNRFGDDRVAELSESDEGWDPKAWAEVAELGWLGLSAPESAGGSGMGFIEETVIFEEMGRALVPGPFFSTVALCHPSLEKNEELLGLAVSGRATFTLAWAESGGSGDLADAARNDIRTKAEGSGDSATLSGEKILVPDLNCVDRVLVTAAGADGVGIWAIEKAAAEVTILPTLDGTRRYGTLLLQGTPATVVVSGADAAEVLERTRLRALAALSVEAVGVAQRALEFGLTHAKERTQFGKPIGSYQAVAHQVADSYVAVELARSLAYWAAWCVAEGDEQAGSATAAAKAFAAEAAVGGCERAIQVLGGIGFTYEHFAHRLYKRAQWLDSFEGFGAAHRAHLADRLLA